MKTGTKLNPSLLPFSSPHVAFSLESNRTRVVVSSVAAEKGHPDLTIETLQIAETTERQRYSSYGNKELVELKEAIQASVMWLVVYVP